MISELTVLIDILPSYRLRIPKAQDTKVKLKKQVRMLQDFEASMLSSYQKFLKFLDGKAKLLLKNDESTGSTQTDCSIATTAIVCLSELLKTKSNFNFSRNLIVALIPFADSSSKSIYMPVRTAIETVFKVENYID